MKKLLCIMMLVLLFAAPALGGYYGSWKIDDNLTFTANTHDPSTAAATDADSVPAYRIYEDETGSAILNGSMALLDDANTTGFYSEQIALSAANGFEKGKSYTIYISAAVSSTTGTISHNFQIEAEVDANTNSGSVTVGTNNDKTGYSIADSTSDAVIADAVWNAAVASYGSASTYGLLIETDLDATISSRSTLTAANVWETNISAYSGEGHAGTYLDALYDNQGNWITATGFSTHGAADVWSVASRTLTALDEDDMTIDLNGTEIGSVAGAVGSVSGAVGSISGITFPTHFSDLSITETTGYVTYANAAPPSAATISSQVTSDLGSAHGAGSWATATGFSTHSAADVKTAIEAGGSSIASILADTGELQADWANDGRLDLLLDSAAAGGGLDAAGVRSAIGLASANLDTQLAALPTDADVNTACDAAISDASLATATNQTTIINHLTGIKGATWSDETLVSIKSAVDGVSGGTGSNAVTINIQDAEGTDISDVTVQVWNSDSTVYMSTDTTDAEGNTSFSLDDGSYDVRCSKAGVSFTIPEEITVTEAATFTITGTSIEIGTPSAANACRVYEYCYCADGATPLTTCTGTAKIISLPYDSGSMLHSGTSVAGTYDSETGMVYWDIVQGATVLFAIDDLGIQFQKVVPSSSSARLVDIE